MNEPSDEKEIANPYAFSNDFMEKVRHCNNSEGEER